jgi:hypothetical protein
MGKFKAEKILITALLKIWHFCLCNVFVGCTRESQMKTLTFWRRIFFLILALPVYKMWIIQEPNILELWNELHFEEGGKTESIYHF